MSIRDYAKMLKVRDRAEIAMLIERRFLGRYLDPALLSPNRNGFAIMAICCLTVEALESFRKGWKTSAGHPGGGAAVFGGFFDAHDEFTALRPFAAEFYKHVRCGILHQAETTGGWIIDRKPGLFASSVDSRRVSAYEFGKRLETVLAMYIERLTHADWRDPSWKNARRKLQAICRNCGLPEQDVVKLQ